MEESKQFGARRRESEALAVKYALRNLATNAGFLDETRLTLKMESKIVKDMEPLFKPVAVEDVTVWLHMSETGKGEILCEKEGKRLKSVPARLKKQEYIVTLNENKKRLTEQYRRTRVMLEEAMEEETEFSAEEIWDMLKNPIVAPMVEKLVFLAGEKLGFMTKQGLVDYEGTLTKLGKKDPVQVAHSYHLYKQGNWHEYQKFIFDNQIKQPFKQVFRELYVKTPEEMESFHSLRYAGNQVVPVHSQHRGRLFLPFVDEDPKTSEVLTKILFFAEDKKIKDPFILRQIV